MSQYIHDEEFHNLNDPGIIVPVIIQLLKPESVVDIGCGIGTFLHEFKKHGVKNILGIDGNWVDKELLRKHILLEEFLEHDLTEELHLGQTYDLVISLEVAEHLPEESAETFVRSLTNSGSLILFSAAIPEQGGQNHINEQYIPYWEEKFKRYNFVLHDIIRPIFWDNPDLFPYYKQNMVLFCRNNFVLPFEGKPVPMRNIVHYELFQNKIKRKNEVIKQKNNTIKNKNNRLMNIEKGKEKPIQYLKWFIYSVFGYDQISRIKNLFIKKKSY